MDEKANSKDDGPTLWRLHESHDIFHEVLQDIHGAVKVCCKDLFGSAVADGDSNAMDEAAQAANQISERWRMLQERFKDGVFLSGSLTPKGPKSAEDIWAMMFEELADDGTLM
jgi:hypothetical protein